MSAQPAVDLQVSDRARVVAVALDHLVGRILTNADSDHAAMIFMEACGREGTLTMTDEGLEDAFLDRLLPALRTLERLPPHLVPFMIRRFAWPETMLEANASAELRTDALDLLARHTEECWLPGDQAPLVTDTAELLIDSSATADTILGFVLCIVGFSAIALYLWANSSSP